MAWSGGTYTKWNGVGGWVTDSLTYGIVPDRHDTQDTDFQNGINNCLTKDGQNTPTANLPMGGFKHTGAGSASGTGQYTTYNQLQDSTFAATVASVAINNTSAGTLTQSLFSNDASPTVLAIQKSRGATVGTNTIVANGDALGSIEFRGANGTGYTTAAQIRALVDGVPGATNDMPGALVFYTTPDGSGTVTERMRIDDAGNVGIGRNNPGTYGNLEVGGSAYAATSINSSSGSGAVLILAANGTSETRINTNTNHPMVFYTNNTQRAVIAAAGNVGINATSPQARLHVGGAINSTTAAATYVGTVQIDESGITALTSAGGLEFKGSTTGSGYGSKIVGFDDGALVFASRVSSATWSESLRITNAGDVCVGRTSMLTGVPGFTVGRASGSVASEIISSSIANGESAYMFIRATSTGTRTGQLGVYKHSGITNPAAFMYLQQEDSGSNYIWVSNAGNLMISSTVTNIGTATGTVVGTQTSDERLKNVKPGPFGYGLSDILALTPVEYELKNELGVNKLGFIAQQTQPIIPETVYNTGDAIPNEDPNLPKLGMDYAQIIPVLVKAMQELEARVATLEGA